MQKFWVGTQGQGNMEVLPNCCDAPRKVGVKLAATSEGITRGAGDSKRKEKVENILQEGQGATG